MITALPYCGAAPVPGELLTRFNPNLAYAEHLHKLIDFDVIAHNPQRVVVDSMYGSGRGVIKGERQVAQSLCQDLRA